MFGEQLHRAHHFPVFQASNTHLVQEAGHLCLVHVALHLADLDQLLKKVADLLLEGFQYQNVQIFWVDRENNAIQIKALAGQPKGKFPVGTHRPLDRGIAAWVARTGTANSAAVSNPGTAPGLYLQQQDQSQRLAVADERDRIGGDLHDGVIQPMYAAGLTLEDIASHAENEPENVGSRIEKVVNNLNQAIGDIRRYITDLRPTELHGRRLEEALASLAGYLEDRAGVAVTVDLDMDPSILPERYFVNIWHILQESFSNIEKYAHAKDVLVSLAVREGGICLTIAGDGDGFDLESTEFGRGYGLPNINVRAERLGGVLHIETASGAGAKLDIRVPMPLPTVLPPLV